MTGCFKKSCIISVIGVFVFLQSYEYIVHGHLLTSLYRQTPSLWRTLEEMNQLFPLVIAKNLALAMIFTCFFKKFRKGWSACKSGAVTDSKLDPATTPCPINSGGLCFGWKLGLIFGIQMAACYIYMPISPELAVAWFFTGLVEGLGVGILLGICCRNQGMCASK